MPFDDDMKQAAAALLDACRTRYLKLATAESCTGGLIAGLLTAVPGSSAVVERGFVTYTNEAKWEMLDVPVELFQRVGAVSKQVAKAMAEGAVARSHAQLAVAVTGVAGPGGGSKKKPVGLVHIAAARSGATTRHKRYVFKGDRDAVRRQTVSAAIALLMDVVEG